MYFKPRSSPRYEGPNFAVCSVQQGKFFIRPKARGRTRAEGGALQIDVLARTRIPAYAVREFCRPFYASR